MCLGSIQIKRKSKRSDSFLWQKPYMQRTAEMSKRQSDNKNNATKKFDYTAIADWLGMVSWSNYGHPTGVANRFTAQPSHSPQQLCNQKFDFCCFWPTFLWVISLYESLLDFSLPYLLRFWLKIWYMNFYWNNLEHVWLSYPLVYSCRELCLFEIWWGW